MPSPDGVGEDVVIFWVKNSDLFNTSYNTIQFRLYQKISTKRRGDKERRRGGNTYIVEQSNFSTRAIIITDCSFLVSIFCLQQQKQNKIKHNKTNKKENRIRINFDPFLSFAEGKGWYAETTLLETDSWIADLSCAGLDGVAGLAYTQQDSNELLSIKFVYLLSVVSGSVLMELRDLRNTILYIKVPRPCYF